MNRIPLSLLSLLWARGPHPGLENLVCLQLNVEVSSVHQHRAMYVCVYHTVLAARPETPFLCNHFLSTNLKKSSSFSPFHKLPTTRLPFMDARHQHCRNPPTIRIQLPILWKVPRKLWMPAPSASHNLGKELFSGLTWRKTWVSNVLSTSSHPGVLH